MKIPSPAAKDGDIGFTVAVVIRRNRRIRRQTELPVARLIVCGLRDVPSAVAENGDVGFFITVVIQPERVYQSAYRNERIRDLADWRKYTHRRCGKPLNQFCRHRRNQPVVIRVFIACCKLPD